MWFAGRCGRYANVVDVATPDSTHGAPGISVKLPTDRGIRNRSRGATSSREEAIAGRDSMLGALIASAVHPAAGDLRAGERAHLGY